MAATTAMVIQSLSGCQRIQVKETAGAFGFVQPVSAIAIMHRITSPVSPCGAGEVLMRRRLLWAILDMPDWII